MSDTGPKHTAPEIKEGEPKITVEFFFSTHGTREDIDGLREALKRADVYVPEAVDWSEKDIKIVQEMASRERGEEEQASIKEELFYNLKKPIIFVDLPHGHSVVGELYSSMEAANNSYKDFFEGKPNQAIKMLRQSLTNEARAIKKREDYIANQLKKELESLTQRFPELKNKKNVRVLVSLGSGHTSIYQKLRQELQSSEITIEKGHVVFSSENEILRRFIRDPSATIDDELYARALMEKVLFDTLVGTTQYTDKMDFICRKLAAQLTISQILIFSRTMSNHQDKVGMTRLYNNLIKQELEKIGLKLPTSETEIDKLLNIKKK